MKWRVSAATTSMSVGVAVLLAEGPAVTVGVPGVGLRGSGVVTGRLAQPTSTTITSPIISGASSLFCPVNDILLDVRVAFRGTQPFECSATLFVTFPHCLLT